MFHLDAIHNPYSLLRLQHLSKERLVKAPSRPNLFFIHRLHLLGSQFSHGKLQQVHHCFAHTWTGQPNSYRISLGYLAAQDRRFVSLLVLRHVGIRNGSDDNLENHVLLVLGDGCSTVAFLVKHGRGHGEDHGCVGL
jgi:hypothetical protein